MSGTPFEVTLDRAAVVVFGIDLRESRGHLPGIRGDIAFGVEVDGRFQEFNYEDGSTTLPFYVEHAGFPMWRERAQISPALLASLRGGNLLNALALWAEAELVFMGKFGEGATVA